MLAVATERLAWGVRIDVPGFRPEEDAFVLVPGVPRTVVLRPLHDGARFVGGTVSALNLIGESPIDAPDMTADEVDVAPVDAGSPGTRKPSTRSGSPDLSSGAAASRSPAKRSAL